MSSKYIPPIVKASRRFPDENAAHAELMALAAELGVDVVLDPEHGLVLPNVKDAAGIEKLLAKISPNLRETSKRVREAKEAGLHIIYIPGSYDLVHKGHNFYVEQVIDAYSTATGIPRSKMFIVMLADDDMLIREVKASKLQANGGDEPLPRPVEPAYERVLGMAAVNVDLVGLLPSPKADPRMHPSVPVLDLDRMQAELEADFAREQEERIAALGLTGEKLEKAQKQAATDLKDLRNALPAYRTMMERDQAGLPLCPEDIDVTGMSETEIAQQIEELKAQYPGYTVKAPKADAENQVIAINIPVQAWQLYTTSILNEVEAGNSGNPQRYTEGHITRVVSHDDTKYLAQVIYLMHYASTAVVIIEDTNNGSTSSLLKKMVEEHGMEAWNAVRAAKAAALEEHVGPGSRDNLLAAAERVQMLMEGVATE